MRPPRCGEWAQTSLDVLDGVVRLDYRPALTDDLYSDIEITEIALFNRDLVSAGRSRWAGDPCQPANVTVMKVDADFVCAAGEFQRRVDWTVGGYGCPALIECL